MTIKKRSRVNVPNAFKGIIKVVKPTVSQSYLDLPKQQREIIRAIVDHTNQKIAAAEQPRSMLLFAGPDGTGKTMSAEFLAHRSKLDLYRIDLSGVVSKYIGETEKNLSKIFTAAETSNAILFFDEADSLFGKRTEVKDSHDRYANSGINYLLGLTENYGGVAILATNHEEASDDAFQRRFNFVVDFQSRSRPTTVRREKKRKGNDDT